MNDTRHLDADTGTVGDTTLVLADGHSMVRSGLRRILEATGRMKVVGETSRGSEAVKMVRQFKPDVAIIDSELRDINGIDFTVSVNALRSTTRVLILATPEDSDTLDLALRAGAMGYLRKDRQDQDLVAAVDMLAAGRMSVPRLSSHQLSGQRRLNNWEGHYSRLLGKLNRSELRVLQLTAEGCTAREIAAKIFLATGSVHNYRGSIRRKLRLKTRQELVRFALNARLLVPDGVGPIYKYGGHPTRGPT